MNTLVIFDSQYGNTEMIARQITSTLLEFGSARALRVTEFTPAALQDVQLLIVGSPTQAWNSTTAMKNFFAALEPGVAKYLFVAAFDTRVDKPQLLTGSAANAMAKQLKQKGVKLLLKPKSFLVTGMEGPLADGEMEHAREWALALHKEFEMRMEPLVMPM